MGVQYIHDYVDFKSDLNLNWGGKYERCSMQVLIHFYVFSTLKVFFCSKKKNYRNGMKNVDFFNGLKSHNSVVFLPPLHDPHGFMFFLFTNLFNTQRPLQPNLKACCVCWHGLFYFQTFGEVTIDFSSCQKAGKTRVEWQGKSDHANEEIIIATHWVPRVLAMPKQ